jgi:hypothetical protein
MSKTLAGVLAAIMLSSTSSGALAQSLTWRVSETAGAVSIRRGAETRPATRNATLAPGDAVVTGAGGRAVLVHNRDFVTVSANSRVTVPQAQEATGFVKIIQDVGNAIFRIEKLGVPHFGVKTPYLAAVVKGTTFSVTVDPTGTSLQVTEGLVEVATLDGGAKDLIRPGSVASIGASDLYRLQVSGEGVRTIDSPSRPVATGAVPAGTVVAVSAPAPVAATEAVAAPEAVSQTIGEAISSKPVDLGGLTGGMLTGTTAAIAATEVASVKIDNAVPPPASEQPVSPAADSASPVVAAPTLPATGGTADPAAPPPVVSGPASPGDPAAPVETPAKDAAPVPDEAGGKGKPDNNLPPAADQPGGDKADKDKADKDKADKGDAKGADEPAKDQADKDAAKAADDAAKAQEKADKDAAKAADDAKKAADDLAKAAEKAANDAAAAAADAKRAADDAAKKAADDLKKAADDLKPDLDKDKDKGDDDDDDDRDDGDDD